MLVKGNLFYLVEFTPGKNSNGAGVKDIIWKLVVRSCKYTLFGVPPEKGTTSDSEDASYFCTRHIKKAVCT